MSINLIKQIQTQLLVTILITLLSSPNISSYHTWYLPFCSYSCPGDICPLEHCPGHHPQNFITKAWSLILIICLGTSEKYQKVPGSVYRWQIRPSFIMFSTLSLSLSYRMLPLCTRNRGPSTWASRSFLAV